MANIQDRYGTESEKKGDAKVVDVLWKFSPTSYDNEKIVVLPYAEYSNFTGNGQSMGAYKQWKINSIYDPDLTGIGVQPLGRDTWASVYNYYKVLETHIKIRLYETTNITTGESTNIAHPTSHGWMADITAAPPSSFQSWLFASLAGKNNKQQKFGPVLQYDVINGRGQKPLVFEYHWDASQFDTSIIDNAKNEWTAVGSDPANINYFSQLYFNPAPVTGGSRTFVWHAEIQYLVAFKQINRTLLNTVN